MATMFQKIHEQSVFAAQNAAKAEDEKWGERFGMCGFAWVNIYEYQGQKLKGNTKIGRALKSAGIDQNWERVFSVWNPSKFPTQNVDTLEAGARAAAGVLQKYGFVAYAGSRLD